MRARKQIKIKLPKQKDQMRMDKIQMPKIKSSMDVFFDKRK